MPRAEVTVEVEQATYDGLQALLDHEARSAMAEGQYERALKFFKRLLQIDPYDVKAMRECGRVANALGDFQYAAEAFARVDDLNGTAPDPEIHYLRAEALMALGKKDEAWREYGVTEKELGKGPHDRQGSLWLARIALLRGDHKKAISYYEPLLRQDDPSTKTYEEVLMYEIEAYIQGKEWDVAERLIRGYLADHPDHERAKALLAWCLEGSGRVEEELALRKDFAADDANKAQKTLEYARALERANEYGAALGRYREAASLGVAEASDGIIRLQRRRSPEMGAGALMRTDPSGDVTGWVAGATMPFGERFRLAVSALSETSSNGLPGVEERRSTAASAWGIFTTPRGAVVALGPTVRLDDEARDAFGGSAILQSSPQRDVQLQVRGDGNVPWHESASVLRDDGRMDTLGATLYLKSVVSSRRVLASIGGQARRLGLEPLMGLPDVRALQIFGSAGVDVTLHSSDRVVRGESFDSQMLAPRSLSEAIVVSYRHYEMTSDNPFPGRVVLVERSSIDELSAVARRVIDRKGMFGAELRGGVGYDWVRYVEQWRAGASLLMAATATSRLTVDYDVASESGTGLSGRRHLGSVNLHVDL
jgi:tetratricopeptide (TPR) repeat protein